MPFVGVVTIPFFCCLNGVLRRSAVIQKDRYNFSLGPVFDIAESYAAAMNLIFTALTFSSGMPLILPLAAFALLIQYLVDKYVVLRWAKKGPIIGPILYEHISRTLPFAIILHLAFGIWVYGCDDIFFCVFI